MGLGALILHLVHTNCAHIRANGLMDLASRMLQYLFFLWSYGGFSGWILSEKSVLLVHVFFCLFHTCVIILLALYHLIDLKCSIVNGICANVSAICRDAIVKSGKT